MSEEPKQQCSSISTKMPRNSPTPPCPSHKQFFFFGQQLSSCQIYNVKNQVQSDNLGGLALFLEYGTLAKEFEGGQDVDVRPFQRLEFLVRDWQNWEGLDDPAQVELRTTREQVLYTRSLRNSTLHLFVPTKFCLIFRTDISSCTYPPRL